MRRNNNNSKTRILILIFVVPLILVLALTYTSLEGCKPSSEGFFERLKYMKDPRTDLCFAVLVRLNNQPQAFTQVPCTAAVMKEVDR